MIELNMVFNSKMSQQSCEKLVGRQFTQKLEDPCESAIGHNGTSEKRLVEGKSEAKKSG